jgi:hypothetical protein
MSGETADQTVGGHADSRQCQELFASRTGLPTSSENAYHSRRWGHPEDPGSILRRQRASRMRCISCGAEMRIVQTDQDGVAAGYVR